MARLNQAVRFRASSLEISADNYDNQSHSGKLDLALNASPRSCRGASLPVPRNIPSFWTLIAKFATWSYRCTRLEILLKVKVSERPCLISCRRTTESSVSRQSISRLFLTLPLVSFAIHPSVFLRTRDFQQSRRPGKKPICTIIPCGLPKCLCNRQCGKTTIHHVFDSNFQVLGSMDACFLGFGEPF